MKYVSTRGQTPACTVTDAIRAGLAPDGGLFVPATWPDTGHPEFGSPKFGGTSGSVSRTPLATFAARTLAPFFADDPISDHLQTLCEKAFTFPIPVRELDDRTSLLELFHGPTASFKDFGARLLAAVWQQLELSSLPGSATSDRRKPLVLVATSGDTGGAVAAAFRGCTQIPVVILYPKGKISRRQEMQLTTWGGNVHAVAVKGPFDDCQRLVKEAFLAKWWQERYALISANSINIGRLLPQMANFAYVSTQFSEPVHFVVPSGNLGHGVAALWAKKIGFPIGKVIFAHNANSAVADFFRTGKWQPKPSVSTLANAMDVGNPSNFERLTRLFPRHEDLLKVASAISVTDDQIREAIRQTWRQYHVAICPHTAAAMHARQQLGGALEGDRKRPPRGGHTKPGSNQGQRCIVVATAHPAKFESIVEPLIGEPVPAPKSLNEIMNKQEKFIEIEPELQQLQASVEAFRN